MSDILGTLVDGPAAATSYDLDFAFLRASGMSTSRARVIARQNLMDLVAADPFVQWLARVPLLQFPDQTLSIMRALPATLDVLNETALALGWCPTWYRYVDRARADGVL